MRLAILGATVALAAAGCASDRWERTELKKTERVEVYVEHRVEDDQVVLQGYDHPFVIDGVELAAIFAELEYWESKFLYGKQKHPVFQPDELARLTPLLSKALAEVGPDERILFLSRNWGGGLIFSSRRYTRGVVFAEPGGILNIAFSDINEEIYPVDYAELGRGESHRDPTSVADYGRPLEKRPWLILKPSEESGVHPAWAVVDVKAALLSIAEGTAPAEETNAAAPPPEPAADRGAPAAEPIPEEPPAAAAEKNLKEKLKLLKELLDEGLITEDEYKQKKKELLESF